MKVKYVGQSRGVRVPEAGNAYVAQGETIEVPEALGKSLLEQPTNWERARGGKSNKDQEDDSA